MGIVPGNVNIKRGSVSVQVRWSPQFVRNAEIAFGSGGAIQKYIDSTIYESIEKYVPRVSGTMYDSASASASMGTGEIVWTGPQVRLLYYGIIMVDPDYLVGGFHNPLTGRFWSRRGVEKILDPGGRKFRFSGAPLRGDHWPERWMRDNLTSFTSDLQRKAGELLRR